MSSFILNVDEINNDLENKGDIFETFYRISISDICAIVTSRLMTRSLDIPAPHLYPRQKIEHISTPAGPTKKCTEHGSGHL